MSEMVVANMSRPSGNCRATGITMRSVDRMHDARQAMGVRCVCVRVCVCVWVCVHARTHARTHARQEIDAIGA